MPNTPQIPSLLSARAGITGISSLTFEKPMDRLLYFCRSEGFPRAAYFVPGRDGMGVWPVSKIVRPAVASRPRDLSVNSSPTMLTPYKPEMGWVPYNYNIEII